jgi:hypothetical protein
LIQSDSRFTSSRDAVTPRIRPEFQRKQLSWRYSWHPPGSQYWMLCQRDGNITRMISFRRWFRRCNLKDPVSPDGKSSSNLPRKWTIQCPTMAWKWQMLQTKQTWSGPRTGSIHQTWAHVTSDSLEC